MNIKLKDAKKILFFISFFACLFSLFYIPSKIEAASIPQTQSYSNTNTYANLNTITDTNSITFSINYDISGDIKWYKDGVLLKTDMGVITSSVATAWTSADYGKVKEIKVNSTTADGISTDTVWNVEVEPTGTATIAKHTFPQSTDVIDYMSTLWVSGSGWTNLPSLYLFAKQSDNAWIEYVKAKTYILKLPIKVAGATLYINSDTAKDIKMRAIPNPDPGTVYKPTDKIRVSGNGTIIIDGVNFYGWDTQNDTEITINNESPIIASDGNNTMNITNSNFRHIMVGYYADKSAGDVVDNNSFLEGTSYNVQLTDESVPNRIGAQGQIITNNIFVNGHDVNIGGSTTYMRSVDNNGVNITNNKFITSPGSVGKNVSFGQGTTFIGNDVTFSNWNLIDGSDNIFSKYNNLHDSGGYHNGFNMLEGVSYYLNEYCHDFPQSPIDGSRYQCFYVQAFGSSQADQPHDIYIFNSYAKVANGINIHGGHDIYVYNYTDDGATNNFIDGGNRIVYRKSNFISNPGSGVTHTFSLQDVTAGWQYVQNAYMIDSWFSDQNNLDYYIYSDPQEAPGSNPIIYSINTFRKNSDGSLHIPVAKNYGDLVYNSNWQGEVRNYAYLDALVQDNNGNPIPNATITITPLTDTNYPAIKVNLPPPPPNLNGYPAQNLPMPDVSIFDSIQTDSTGHTSLPNYGLSTNTEATPALLFYRQKANNVNFTSYSYRITATSGSNTVSKDITPDSTWYREDPTQPSKTVILTFNKPSGKSALNINSGSGSGLYTPGQSISITASPAPTGKVFDKWIGDTTGITDIHNATTTITVQATDASLTPYYKDILYHLIVNTVENGVTVTGSGDYPAGKIVVVDAPATNGTRIFYKWTGTGLSSIVSPSVYSSTLIMPSSNITVTANYRNPISYSCHLTVANGTGTDFYAPADTIQISANPPAPGKVFDHWEGDADNLANPSASNTTLTNMPDKYLILYPVYIDSGITATPTFSPPGGTYSTNQTVSITDATTNAIIHYTTDNTNPTASSPTYSTPLTISTSTTIKAIAIKTGYTDSAISSAIYTITGTVASPSFSPAAGTYTSSQTISISSATSGASIYYTTNGTTPTVSSTYYTGSITISATTTLKAIAIKTDYADSAASSAIYTINTSSGGGGGGGGSSSGGGGGSSSSTTPTIIKTEIKSITANNVILNLSVTNASSMMLSDNTNFTGSNWVTYTPIPTYIKKDTQSTLYLKFKSTSGITSSTITLSIPTPTNNANPTFSISSGTYSNSQTVTITASPNAIIHYTLDGTTPTSTSPIYTTPLTIDKTTTLKAIAIKEGYPITSVSSSIYTINPSSTNPTLYPDGTLLKLSSSPRVYVVIQNKKKWISTPEVFEQLGYQWTSIQTINDTTLKSLPDYEDNLIRERNDYKVYLIVNGVKRHIPNPQIFLDYGFLWTDVVDTDQSTIDKYKDTYLIKESGKDGVYYINQQGVRKLIPTTDIFNSYNDKMSDVQIVSNLEMESYPLSNLIRLNTSNDVYLIQGNIKKHIPNIKIANKYKLNLNQVMSVNQQEFNFYQSGGELK
jgi:hypothetical protein